MKNEKNINVLSLLGNGCQLSSDQFQDIQKLYLQILGKKGETADEARKIIFSRSSGMGVKFESLPCTTDALYQHTMRASLQKYMEKCRESFILSIKLHRLWIQIRKWGAVTNTYVKKSCTRKSYQTL